LLDEHQKMTVTEIYVKLRLEQSVASQHLAILRRAGIVSTSRDGKFIFYSVNYNRLAEVGAICGNTGRLTGFMPIQPFFRIPYLLA
jgi:DNA-binding transcriptional ArsR family regulator